MTALANMVTGPLTGGGFGGPTSGPAVGLVPYR